MKVKEREDEKKSSFVIGFSLLAIGLTISVEALTLVTGASLVFLDLAQGS